MNNTLSRCLLWKPEGHCSIASPGIGVGPNVGIKSVAEDMREMKCGTHGSMTGHATSRAYLDIKRWSRRGEDCEM